MRAERSRELRDVLGHHPRDKSSNMSKALSMLTEQMHLAVVQRTYPTSASFWGPVDTGFKYSTRLSGLSCNARHSNVDTMVLPTLVLAPKTCHAFKSRHSIARAPPDGKKEGG